MYQKPIKYYRLYFGVISIVVASLFIGLMAKIIVYFNSGADRSTALNLPPTLPEAHVPRIKWCPDDAYVGREMEDFNRQTIMKDYIRGWYQQHLSGFSGEITGMKEYFTPTAFPKAINVVNELKAKGLRLHQTDLEHNIQLHFYSEDGQLVAFTDKQVTIKQRLYRKDNQQKIYSGGHTSDYEVIMLLDDGYWRIKNMLRKPATAVVKDTVEHDNHEMVQVKGTRFSLLGKPFVPKGINYYPQKTPWTFFWTKYDGQIVRRDFKIIKKLGFNTVRIFVNYNDFNKGNVPPERLIQVQNLLDNAQETGIKVIMTLFDFVGDYRLQNFTSTDRQLETLLRAFNKHPAIMAWDLKNEADLDYHYHDPQDVKEWLTWIIKRAKMYDPNHLITLGWAFPPNADFLSKEVDFVSFHSYKTTQELSFDIDKLQMKVFDRPLVLEEFGLSTYRGLWAPLGKTEQDQADYFAKVKQVLAQKGNIPYLAWTLYDFTDVPIDVVGKIPWHRNPQKSFGIIRANGHLKIGARQLAK
jgi:hypothetical protein